MTLSSALLVEPETYDHMIYSLLHAVVDRIIELDSKADTTEEADGDEPQELFELVNSQANFTPTEKQEIGCTRIMLNLLLNVAVARRAALYNLDEEPTE